MTELLIGFLVGFFLFYLFFRYKYASFKELASAIIHRAEVDGEKKSKEKELFFKEKEALHQQELYARQLQHVEHTNHLQMQWTARLEQLKSSQSSLDKKLNEVEKEKALIKQAKSELEKERQKEILLQDQLQSQLEKIGQMSTECAREELFEQLRAECKQNFGRTIAKEKDAMNKEIEKEAHRLMATVLNRVEASSISNFGTTLIQLPHEEMKARIIGKDGKNIRAFEERSRVNIIVDGTPKALTLSCFDPIRKAIAELALKELIQDGKIYPTRIEEALENGKRRIGELIEKEGARAMMAARILPLDPHLITILGKLHFIYAGGQNMLQHSMEVANIMGLLAYELGLDVERARRIGLLHDIGKALSSEEEGSHAAIGMKMALKYGESHEIANGIGSHHGQIIPETVEASFCPFANTVSKLRMDSISKQVDPFIRRLCSMEAIAKRFSGVCEAFALQAGCEVRVVVQPEQISDDELDFLAYQIAQAIGQELSFLGKIKVVAIREKRATEYAS